MSQRETHLQPEHRLEPIKVTNVGITNFGIQLQCKGFVWFQQLMTTEIRGGGDLAKHKKHAAVHAIQLRLCGEAVTRGRNNGIKIGDNERPKSLNIEDHELRKSTIFLEIHIT